MCARNKSTCQGKIYQQVLVRMPESIINAGAAAHFVEDIMTGDEGARLSVVDYVVLLFALSLSGGIGAYFGFKAKSGKANMDDFLLGGRTLRTFPVALSMMATVLSAGTMVGVIGEVYLYGAQYIFFPLGGAVGMVFAAYQVIPVYRRFTYISIYEYLEKRFDRKLRIAYSFLYIFVFIIFVSVALYVPAISLSTLDGIPQWVSIVCSGVVCVIYCVIGGFRAVVWTDVLQTALMTICMMTIVIKGTIDVGGIYSLWAANVRGERIGTLTLVESVSTRYSVWSLFIGGAFILINACCAGQAGVQRILSVKGERQAVKVTLQGAGITVLYMIGLVLTGVVIYAYFATCDPLTLWHMSHDQIFLYAISRMLRGIPGLQGLAIAGIFSGSLSSFSSYINSFAALTVEDFILPILNDERCKVTERRRLWLCKATTVIYGVAGIILAFLVPYLGGIVQTCIFITGALGGPLLGLLLMGMFSRRASTSSSLIGLVSGLVVCVWIALGGWLFRAPNQHLPLFTNGCDTNFTAVFNSTQDRAQESAGGRMTFLEHLYSMSFMWYGPVGIVITIAVGTCFSFIFANKKEVDERLLSPFVQRGRPTTTDRVPRIDDDVVFKRALVTEELKSTCDL